MGMIANTMLLQQFNKKIGQNTFSKETPLYLYCLRGSRSKRAANVLKRMDYEKVFSIGGINRYKGEDHGSEVGGDRVSEDA